jgi:hypothetical protein
MKGLSVKFDPLEQTARYWMGQGKQEAHLERETSRRLSLRRDRGHEGRIREMLQEDGCLSMYEFYSCVLACMIITYSHSTPCNYYISRD